MNAWNKFSLNIEDITDVDYNHAKKKKKFEDVFVNFSKKTY